MRSFLVALIAVLLVGCSSSESPKSAYYIISFEPSGATLRPEGGVALEQAVRDAGHGRPSSVTVKAYVPADGSGRELAAQRIAVVEQALVAESIPTGLVHVVQTKADADAVARLGDGLVVQIERGNPAPRNPVDDE